MSKVRYSRDDMATEGEDPFDVKLSRYASYLRIDRDNLDDEVSRHAEYYEKVAEIHVLAIAAHDALSQDLDEAIVREDPKVRERLAEEGKKTPTETAVKNAIKDSPKIQKLAREVLSAKLRVDRAAVLKESFGQRSYMLKELVGLYISRRLSTGAHTAREDLQDYAAKRSRAEITRSVRR